MTALISKLEALAAQPRTWRVAVVYKDGKIRHVDCHSETGAHNHADIERRKIGRDLIAHGTGETVRVIEVYVEKIPT